MATGGVPGLVRYDLLFQALGGPALIALDPDGRIAGWSAGAETLTGHPAAAAIGQSYELLFDPAAIGLDAVRDEQGALIGFVETRREAAEPPDERQAQAAQAQRELAGRMEALGRLAGVMAHDFNNLLTAVLSRAELALRAVDHDRERLVKMIVGVRDAAQRGAAMNRRLLGFAGRQPLDPVRVELKPLLAALAEDLRQVLPADIQLVVEAPDRLAMVEADPQGLRERLMDLALNARDAMPEGGRLTIAARGATLNGEGAGLFGPHVLITVTDTGHGMAPEVRERAVEPFFTTRDGGTGTGLGLSQAYGFARQSHGALSIVSEPGLGTTISLYLPADDLVAEDASPADPAPTPAHEAVLVVEDDRQVAELTDALFRELGYEPVMARSPREAMEALARLKIDLVFSDVVMPGGLSGFELARRIRMRFPEIPILLTTGYGEALAQRDVCEFPVLNKPYRIDELIEALGALRRGSGGEAKPH
ncbi:ATP-binding protein [Phenylobacterium montanum]|uniref:histidine kinase n=1 Tax=Phenylobacterium montanum TaxID=2823693 RepID=A0A975G0Z6_9CAUL|nr:ATP-binding protein [Caulobacter sp. S6]QUD88482.1 response regulator [Caulobacter sp. S6]